MQQRVYEIRISNFEELKQRLVEIWNVMQQSIIDVKSANGGSGCRPVFMQMDFGTLAVDWLLVSRICL
jgi:hypothetical protein